MRLGDTDAQDAAKLLLAAFGERAKASLACHSPKSCRIFAARPRCFAAAEGRDWRFNHDGLVSSQSRGPPLFQERPEPDREVEDDGRGLQPSFASRSCQTFSREFSRRR